MQLEVLLKLPAIHSFGLTLDIRMYGLPRLTGVIYFLQSKVSMMNMTAEQQKQMKIMGMLSPIMIVMFSLNAPSALPLYWTIGGIFLIIQTLLARKIYQTKDTSVKVEQQV